MAFCVKCGNQINDGDKFCNSCGAKIGSHADDFSSKVEDFSSKVEEFNNTADTTSEYDARDISENKAMGILAYLSWLVLIPIFAAPNSRFARFHANQGLVLAIVELIWWVGEGILTGIFWVLFGYRLWFLYATLTSLLGIVNIAFVALMIIGIVNAANGHAKELPIIGKIKILK